jgi:hypothetical protein
MGSHGEETYQVPVIPELHGPSSENQPDDVMPFDQTTALAEELHSAVCSRLGLEKGDALIEVTSQSVESRPSAPQDPPRADDPRFRDAILTEFRGLLSRGVFNLVSESELPRGANVLGSRSHLTIKSTNEDVRYKARLVVQGHLDSEKEFIVPEAPTLSHLSLRIIVSMAVL